MTRFFLDTEYTNGNYYQGDIFEIALVSENTYRIFHQYVKIPYSVPNNVKRLCNISDKVLQQKGVSFTHMIKRLTRFVKSETKTPTIIAHAGYAFDFPLLFTNCMKHNLNVQIIFQNYAFVDSVKVLQNAGVRKPGLHTIANASYQRHSAASDAKTLVDVFNNKEMYANLIKQNDIKYSVNDMLQVLRKKLPISIDDLCYLSSSVNTREELTYILKQYVRIKSALSSEQLLKVSIYAFKYLCLKYENFQYRHSTKQPSYEL